MTGGASVAPAVRLVAVTPENRAGVAALRVDPSQTDFVAANIASLEEADRDRDARPRAVMAGNVLIGFLMYDATDRDDVRLYRFMIDSNQQGRGYGRAALSALLEEVRAIGGVTRISICYEPENEAARMLYRKAGFVEEGLDEDGEMIAALGITGLSNRDGPGANDAAGLPGPSMDPEFLLTSAIAKILPAGVFAGCRTILPGDRSLLLPVESVSLTLSRDSMRDASGAARHVARGLMVSAGLQAVAVPRGDQAAPVWPAGLVGSMAHDDAFAVAAIARPADYAALGIDVEPAEPLPDDVAQIVRIAGDVTDGIDETIAARLLFSAKEAVYKAVFPGDRIVLGYEDIFIDFPARLGRTGKGRSLQLAWITAPRILVLAYEAP
jgi:4'-phosphopantetheinyl transferase EntD/RimJ/RimL family protein N-acetyltransferase